MGRKELGMSEEEVWKCTPRKYYALMDCAIEYNKKKNSSGSKGDKKKSSQPAKPGYIDDLKW